MTIITEKPARIAAAGTKSFHETDLVEQLRHATAGAGEKAAFIEDDRVISYRQFWAQVDLYADFLVAEGIKENHIVVVCANNSFELASLILALLKLKASPFLLNKDKLAALQRMHPSRIRCVISGATTSSVFAAMPSFIRQDIAPGFSFPFDLYIRKSAPASRNRRYAGSLMLTSSGSTGTPKIIVTNTLAVYNNIVANCTALDIRSSDISLMILPMAYSYGLIGQLFSNLYKGATIVIGSNTFFLLQIFRLIPALGITTIFTVPPMLRQWLAMYQPPDVKRRLATLRLVTVGGSHIDDYTLERSLSYFPCPVAKTYGLAEAGPRVSTRIIQRFQENEFFHSGYPLSNARITILGKNGRDAGTGKPGRIVVHSNAVASGYYGHSARAINPGKTVLSSDTGMLLTNGELLVFGKTGHNISLQGKKIWFAEIENSLYNTGKIIKVIITKKRQVLLVRVLLMAKVKMSTEDVLRHLCRQYGESIRSKLTVEFVNADAIRLLK